VGNVKIQIGRGVFGIGMHVFSIQTLEGQKGHKSCGSNVSSFKLCTHDFLFMLVLPLSIDCSLNS